MAIERLQFDGGSRKTSGDPSNDELISSSVNAGAVQPECPVACRVQTGRKIALDQAEGGMCGELARVPLSRITQRAKHEYQRGRKRTSNGQPRSWIVAKVLHEHAPRPRPIKCDRGFGATLMRYLTAIPVYNEADHIDSVLDQITAVASDVLVVDDGSLDATPQRLARRRDIRRVTHPQNRGYGAALRTAFKYAQAHDYGVLVTIDADGQHDPRLIERFVEASECWDVVSGSRYLTDFAEDSAAPSDRRAINQAITRELNRRLGLHLTDAFCGFKAYRVSALSRLHLIEDGYAMPLELWIQMALAGLSIRELAVPRIYLDASRSFGGKLDDPEARLTHYREVIASSLKRAHEKSATSACRAFAWVSQPCVCSH
jgi:hypothetical protein